MCSVIELHNLLSLILFLDICQEHGESIYNILFSPSFSGVLCDRVFALHYVALEYLREIRP